ncbi:MAG: HemK2/MTQ2 family protein methyltransferase [Candidatus Asgardarchaeum sp.]
MRKNIIKKAINYPEGFKLLICKRTYPPSEDSYLIIDSLLKINLKNIKIALDVGCGSGIITCFLARFANKVYATDINPYALNCTANNIILNKLSNRVILLYSDLFSSIPPEIKFDLIVFNPPYLPINDTEKIADEYLELAWCGGRDGTNIIINFLLQAIKHLYVGGRIVLLISSLSNVKKIYSTIKKLGLKYSVIANYKTFFEELKVLLISE